MEYAYLVRYGVMGHVGQFSSDSADFNRGRSVVIRSHRGTELGEVLLEIPRASEPGDASSPACILRAANSEDLERASQADRERPLRFARCLSILQDGRWPMELIDVEILLDPGRIILHHLGPRPLDLAGLLSTFRSSDDLDVMLESVGRDASDTPLDLSEAPSYGQSGAGCGGCGSGGGCGASPDLAWGGCSDCGVKKLLASSRRISSR